MAKKIKIVKDKDGYKVGLSLRFLENPEDYVDSDLREYLQGVIDALNLGLEREYGMALVLTGKK